MALLVALPFTALEAWNLYSAARTDAQRARDQVFHLARITASETARFLGQAHNILNGLVTRPAVRALDPARCDPLLKEFLDLAPRFSNVVTSTLDGRVICSAKPLAGPTRVDPDVFLKRLRPHDQLTVGQATPGTISGRWAVPVGLPLLDAQGGVAGAVALTIDLLRIPLLPRVEGLSVDVAVAIIALDGTVLARSQQAERFVGTNQRNQKVARVVLRERSGTSEETGIDGTRRIQGFTPIPGTDWIAISSRSASAVYAGVNARAVRSALLTIGVLCAVLLLAMYWGRKIQGPISALADTVHEIAAGKSAERAPVGGPAEVAEFATEFNHMLEALELSSTENKRLVQIIEQTSDLVTISALDGSLVYGNRPFRDLLGLRPDQGIEGFHSSQAYPEGRWEFARTVARPAAAKLDRWSGETVFRSHDGREVPVLMVLMPMKNDRGEIVSYAAISRDISEHKQAEQILRESEARFRALSELSTDWYWEQDAEFRFKALSDTVAARSGNPVGDVVGSRRWELPGRVPLSGNWDEHRAVVEAHQPFRDFEYVHTNPDGEVRYVSITGVPVFDADNRFAGYRGTGLNVTARVRAELERERIREEMQTSRVHLQAILDSLFAFVGLFSLDGVVLEVNEAPLRFGGIRREDVIGTKFVDTRWWSHSSEMRDRVTAMLHRAASGESVREELTARGGNDDISSFDTIFSPLRDKQGVVVQIVGSAVDVTERARNEDALRESRANLQALSRRLLEVQEAERRALARELHDEVGGVLTALKLNLQALHRQGRGKGRDDVLMDGLGMVDGAIDAVRTLSLDLRPVILDDLGLIPALKWYCARQAALFRVPIKLALHPVDLKAAPQLESACFRIVQEGVANALRHAKARRIEVALHRVDAGLTLEISDNGGGFDMATAHTRALAGDSSGLHGMDERVKLLGGKLSVDSAPGKGTRIRAEFSMPEGGFG